MKRLRHVAHQMDNESQRKIAFPVVRLGDEAFGVVVERADEVLGRGPALLAVETCQGRVIADAVDVVQMAGPGVSEVDRVGP